MAFTPGGNETDTNGTTNVTAVAAPAASTKRMVSQVIVHNVSAAVIIANVYVNKNSTVRRVARTTLQIGETLTVGGYVLDATDESIEVDLDAAHVTTAPTIVASFADVI
jgi:hypothetical protein